MAVAFILIFYFFKMVSIANLTPRQAAVSSGHGIGFVVRTIGNMVSKVYNGLRTWGSGANRTKMQQLSRPSSVTRSQARPIDSSAKLANTMMTSKVIQNTPELKTGDDQKIVSSNFAKRAASDKDKTRNILSEVRKGGPAKFRSSQASKLLSP